MKIDKSRIEVIFFDFMGVLMFPRKNYAAEETADAIDEMIGQVVDDREFKKMVQARYHINDERFHEILCHIANKYDPYLPIWSLLSGLRRKYKLGIINNGTKLTFPYFDAQLKITERFDIFVSSAEAGVRKPDSLIYLHACRQLGVEPRVCLFMDDARQNVFGAQQAGMQTIHWQTPASGYQRFLEIVKVSEITNTGAQDGNS